MITRVNLKMLKEKWTANPRVTRNELVNELQSSAQNITRWMESTGLCEIRDFDKEWRYIPRPGVTVRDITEEPPIGLNERRKTEFYIDLGYDSYSIALHQNILWATVEEVREESRRCKEVEYNQHKNNFTEQGDASPLPESGDLMDTKLFTNDDPKLSWKERHDISWQDIIHRVRETSKKHAGYYKVDDCVPYFPMLIRVPAYALRYFAAWHPVPNVGNDEANMMALLFALARDTESFLIHKRWSWIGEQVSSVREEMSKNMEDYRRKRADELEKNKRELGQQQIDYTVGDEEQHWNG